MCNCATRRNKQKVIKMAIVFQVFVCSAKQRRRKSADVEEEGFFSHDLRAFGNEIKGKGKGKAAFIINYFPALPPF